MPLVKTKETSLNLFYYLFGFHELVEPIHLNQVNAYYFMQCCSSGGLTAAYARLDCPESDPTR